MREKESPFPPNRSRLVHWLVGCDPKRSPWTWCNGCFYRSYNRLHPEKPRTVVSNEITLTIRRNPALDGSQHGEE